MHDNAPLHAARLSYLNKVVGKHGKIMEWPPFLLDLNAIESLWSILKRKIYTAERQYHTTDELGDAIITAAGDVYG